MANETLECFRDCLFRRGVDEDIRNEFREFVAGRSVDGPIRTQSFVIRENFFDHEIDRAAVLRQWNPERGRGTSLQFLEVFPRQIKSVRMIDPTPVTAPFAISFRSKLCVAS